MIPVLHPQQEQPLRRCIGTGLASVLSFEHLRAPSFLAFGRFLPGRAYR